MTTYTWVCFWVLCSVPLIHRSNASPAPVSWLAFYESWSSILYSEMFGYSNCTFYINFINSLIFYKNSCWDFECFVETKDQFGKKWDVNIECFTPRTWYVFLKVFSKFINVSTFHLQSLYIFVTFHVLWCCCKW